MRGLGSGSRVPIVVSIVAASIALLAVDARAESDRPPGRFLGTFAVTANPIDVVDANPLYLGGSSYRDLSERDLANIDLYAAGRVGAAADGTSALLLRAKVAGRGSLECSVEGDGNGNCEAASLRSSAPVAGAHVAAAIYYPPDTFGPAGGDTPQRYMGAVETREIVLRLSFHGSDGTVQIAEKRILLARPPLVLVHGTFDKPAVWHDAVDGSGFFTAAEAAGFKAFTVDYGSGGGWLSDGGTNQASFKTNRDVVWANAGGIKEALEFYRRDLSIAATRADVVGHSLGGLLPRVYASPDYDSADDPYLRPDNFNKGDINRLVTICSPHHGSVLPAVLKVFAEPDLDRAGVLGAALGKVTLTLKQYLDGLSTDTDSAVHDQMPGSEALRKIRSTPIPSFAVGCIAGAHESDDPAADPNGDYKKRVSDLTWLFYLAPGLLEQYLVGAEMEREADQLPWMLDAFYRQFVERLGAANVGWLTAPEGAPDPRAHYNPQLQQVFRALLFQYHPNDYTVALESQHGGLGPQNRRDVDGVLHGVAPGYRAVQGAVLDLLRGRQSGGEFATAGFPPAGQPVHPANPSDELIALLSELTGGDAGAEGADRRTHIARLLDAVQSDAYLRDEEAIRWSGMVYAHAVKFMQVAEDERTVFIFRPVNPDSTRLIAANAATKPMAIKAKSSDWGPHRGLLPVDQAFSKKAESTAETIGEFNCDAYGNLASNNAFAVPLTIKVGGIEYEVRRTIQSSGNWESYDCEQDARGKYVPTARFISSLAASLRVGERQPLVLFRVDENGEAEFLGADDAPVPELPLETSLPFLVFADADGKHMTADYDMLAIGSQEHECLPGGMDPVYGAICDWQIPLIEALNRAAATGECEYSGGNLVHHGPEAQYPGSQYIDYPVIAFIPAWRGDPSRIVAVRQGPEGYRDMHLKRLLGMLRLHGWKIDPNPKAVGWQWGEFDETTGYAPDDQATFPDDAPEEIVPAAGAAVDKSCDPAGGGDPGDDDDLSQFIQSQERGRPQPEIELISDDPSDTAEGGYTPGAPRSHPRYKVLDEVRDWIRDNPAGKDDYYVAMSPTRAARGQQKGALVPSSEVREGPAEAEHDAVIATPSGSGPHGYTSDDGTQIVRIRKAFVDEALALNYSNRTVIRTGGEVVASSRYGGRVIAVPGPAADRALYYVESDGRLRTEIPRTLVEQWDSDSNAWVPY